ncbi:terminase [Magnetococcus sp. PR-3]|uniref:terminase n=1 Tax=Magnetococcus sp. PR-3 TaxID=3120355 RepID=UPI002FCE6216
MKLHEAKQLGQWLHTVQNDPLAYIKRVFPWGKEGLQGYTGLAPWQRQVAEHIRQHLQQTPHQPCRIAVASGHGIGKSAFVGMLLNWAMDTLTNTRGVVTANTDTQLRTKTWAELSKWHNLNRISPLLNMQCLAASRHAKGREKTWAVHAIPWSETHTEGFAGLHNQGKRIVVVFDEASAIPDIIWEVTEGALTDADTQIIWIAFGNPTRSTGRFRACFGKYKHLWHTLQVDSRSVPHTNKQQLEEWVETYGEESDFVRVRVRGQFPRQSSSQFIGHDTIQQASQRQGGACRHDPLVMGVDPARFGDDQMVIFTRSGRNGRQWPVIKRRGLDTMQVAYLVAEQIQLHNPTTVFVDEGGLGAGVVDRLHDLGYRQVVGVNFGARALDPDRYVNLRAEMWGKMRDWLQSGMIPNDAELMEDLAAPTYSYAGEMRIQLERKEQMKKRGLASPDVADALALTFAYPINLTPAEGGAGVVGQDYDPLS